ncbi:hypothetical protein KP509_1Z085700 [Ceratopteris richardii]|nr:hypothetical protein KP509_1Z085700 [Ceratopteris richardii]
MMSTSVSLWMPTWRSCGLLRAPQLKATSFCKAFPSLGFSAPSHCVLYAAAGEVVLEQNEVNGTAFSASGDGVFENSSVGDADGNDDLPQVASCPVPEFSSTPVSISLLNPYPNSLESSHGPLLVYAPGMDCTGQGIIRQLPYLIDAGYDVRFIYIPNTDRSSWAQLVQALIPLIKKEILGRKNHHATLLGESFGGPLALRLIKAAPELFSRLVLVNPATNMKENNPLVSSLSGTGLLSLFPDPLYEIAQDILLPFMVNRDRIKWSDNGFTFSPVDFVPAPCASWRLSLLNDNSDLSESAVRSIKTATLLLASSEDHVLSSVEETGRLNRLLPLSKRVILPGRLDPRPTSNAFTIKAVMLLMA